MGDRIATGMPEEDEPGRLSFYKEDIERISKMLSRFIKDSEARCVLLVDKDGHLITSEGEATSFDMDNISALVVGSFDATKQMAKQLGEEEFFIMFQHGEKDNMQISLVGERTIFAVIFDDKTTLGLVRLHASQVSKKLTKLFEVIVNRGHRGPDTSDGPGPTPAPA